MMCRDHSFANYSQPCFVQKLQLAVRFFTIQCNSMGISCNVICYEARGIIDLKMQKTYEHFNTVGPHAHIVNAHALRINTAPCRHPASKQKLYKQSKIYIIIYCACNWFRQLFRLLFYIRSKLINLTKSTSDHTQQSASEAGKASA